jgi:hypothetical protein
MLPELDGQGKSDIAKADNRDLRVDHHPLLL